MDAQKQAIPEQTVDPAAIAFDGLRQEVALARRAVAGLAAERAAIEIPDYSETLGKITQSSATTAKYLKALSERSILQATVQDWANAIAQANTPARQASQDALAGLHRQLRQVADDMAAILRKARTADSQRLWLLWTCSGALLAGILLGVFAIAPLIRAV